MSWTGNNCEAIKQALRNLEQDGGPNAAVQVVSAYYSGAGTTYLQWREKSWRADMLLTTIWWRHQALFYAKTVLETFLANIRLGGSAEDYMLPTVDSVDVLCTVLTRFGRRRYEGELGNLLRFIEPRIDETVSPHTQAFLAMHEVRVGVCEWSDKLESLICHLAEATVKGAERTADESQRLSLFGQAARVFRQLAEFVPEGKRSLYLQHARHCALRGGATDQLLKLGVR